MREGGVHAGRDVGVELAARRARRDREADAVERLRSGPRLGQRRRRGAASALAGPPGSGPAMAASSGPQSSSVRAIGPAWSRLVASGTTPRSDTSPRVGLIVEVPQSAEGMRSEPAVSVPVAAGTMRAASAAAEPPLDPPAVRSSACGLPT